MTHGRHTVAIIGWLATVVLRRWALSCGVEPTHLRQKVIVAWAMVGVGSGLLATLIDTERIGLAPALYASQIGYGISLALFEASMLGAILLVQSLGVVTSRLGLKTLPVSGRLLGLGLGLPVLMVLLAVSALFTPSLVVFLKTAAIPTVGAATLVVASTLVGGSVGALAVSLIARVLSPARRLSALAVPLAVGVWVCASAIGLWRFQIIAMTQASASAWDLWLVWPLVARTALSGTTASLVVAGLLVLGATVVALLAFDPAALSGQGRTAAAVPLVRWTASGAFPLLRLELVRLMRTRHVVHSYRVSAVLVAAAVTWMLAGPAILKLGEGQLLLAVGMGFVCAQTGLLTRGLSARSQPYPLRLGFTPSRWAYAVVTAGAMSGFLLSVPLLCLLVLRRPLPELALVVGFLVLLCALAAVVAFALHPDKDNTSGLVAGEIVLMVGGLLALGTAAVPYGFYRGKLAIGMTLLAAGVFLALLAGALETARWRTSVNLTGEGEQ